MRIVFGISTCLFLFPCLWCCASANSLVNLTVTNQLYAYLFLQQDSAALSSFPYCYDKSAKCKPGEAHSALDVYFELSINQLLEVNEREKSMRLKLTNFIMWLDCRLRWPLGVFPVKELHISIEQFHALNLYVPILMLNEEITPKASRFAENWVSITHSGAVYMERMYTTEVSCEFDISMYPFDSQACNLTFESVLEKPLVSLRDIDAFSPAIMPQYFSLSHLGRAKFILSDTWEVRVGAGNYETRNICYPLSAVIDVEKCLYDLVVHTVVMRRHPAYQLLNLLLPTFLIVIVASCVFLVPPEFDKTNLSITILLSLFFFMQVMYYKMPETGASLPLLTRYYLFCVGLIVLSCLVGTLSVILDSSVRPIPQWIRKIMRRYGRHLTPDKISVIHHLLPSLARSAMASMAGNFFHDLKASGSLAAQNDVFEWHHVACFIDRIFLIMHIFCSFTVLIGHLLWGYIYHVNYGFLMEGDEWKT